MNTEDRLMKGARKRGNKKEVLFKTNSFFLKKKKKKEGGKEMMRKKKRSPYPPPSPTKSRICKFSLRRLKLHSPWWPSVDLK